MCELALELKMTVGEIKHGRGEPMSAHEASVIWPLFFDYRRRENARQEEIARHKQRGRR